MADEFLVHISRDGDYIEGLHPVRSRHIVEYLHEYYPLEETAYNITKLADLQDFSVLFSHYPEFAFDKESFYSDVVNEWWNLEDLKCFVSAIRGTFSGCVMQYFRNNEELFNEANNQGGLFVIATEVCPFAQFREMLCSTLSYPKEHRPFEEEVEVPKKFLEVKQAYFNSMQNFLRQVAGLIQRDENDVRLALYNLKQAKAGLPKMHKFFDGMELDEEMASKHTNLCRQESQKILEIYMCCQYFLQHDASPLFDKYQIRNWYRDVCTKEIEDVNVALDAMQQEYDAVFPDQAYEEAVFKHYPIILRSFDMTSEEVMQDFVLRTIAFAETSFDYMLVLQCDENGAILQHAIKFPKRFFKAIQEALVSGEEITDTSLLTPYPIDVTENMLECFSGDWKIKRQTDNPYVHYLGDIAEELWVYSKLRELLCTEEDREYCICELKKVAEKIAIMKKEIHLHLDEEVADQIDEMCNHVYEGNCFDNIRLNEFVQNLQYIVV